MNTKTKEDLIALFDAVIATADTEAKKITIKAAFRAFYKSQTDAPPVVKAPPGTMPPPAPTRNDPPAPQGVPLGVIKVPQPRQPITANSGRFELMRDLVNMFQADAHLFSYVNEKGFYAPTRNFKVFMANRSAIDVVSYMIKKDGEEVPGFFNVYDVGATKDYIFMLKNLEG